ncbi:MAG TPA: MerR family transcriptional regulator [Allosphingosinicella sp.]|jgi:DNA-binding transcriptional MerR regulator
MPEPTRKSEQAFKTIGELAAELGVPQHILRYWETRFPQLKPLQRAGNRRYYRSADVSLVQRIHRLLSQDGYTIRGVQQLLDGRAAEAPAEEAPAAASPAAAPTAAPSASAHLPTEELRAIRDSLAEALAAARV